MTYPARNEGYTVTSPSIAEMSLPKGFKKFWYILTGQYNHKRLQVIGKCYRERYMSQCWIENDKDGFTGWRWDKFKVNLRIVAAANRYGDIIAIGPRHYSNGMRISIDGLGGSKLLYKYAGGDSGAEQGFVDQYGTFYDRKEAWDIAQANGQILYPDIGPVGTLFSEHLY